MPRITSKCLYPLKVLCQRFQISKWSYLACAIDTEGCVCIFKAKCKKAKEGVRFSTLLTISNTNLEWLEFLKLQYKLKCSICAQKSRRRNRKVCYRLSLSSNEIRRIIPRIKPYVKIKKQQLVLVVKLLSLLHERARTQNGHASREYTKEFTHLWLECKKLNEKGV